MRRLVLQPLLLLIQENIFCRLVSLFLPEASDAPTRTASTAVPLGGNNFQ